MGPTRVHGLNLHMQNAEHYSKDQQLNSLYWNI